MPSAVYRGRLAPSPTGYLHLGHARTFRTAYERAIAVRGTLVLRNEDLDRDRCRSEYVQAMYADLRWLGIDWQEGPDIGGPYAPYDQTDRYHQYLEAWRQLVDTGQIYPCTCSRKDLAQAASAPHEDSDEPLYPGTCRPASGSGLRTGSHNGVNWRFRVPDGEELSFHDINCGEQRFTAGRDFGDFLVWRKDATPSYQLAVTVDDAAMAITEVVRGADLLKSTVRQMLLQRALKLLTPAYFHCELMRDQAGVRLAKRHDALSLRHLREQGLSSEQVLAML
jgi:glutamyl-tRNA synthetase